MALPRALLADDHALLLAAFEKLLIGECEIVGKVADGRALVAAAERLKPELIVLDISMPILNGLDAGAQIKRRFPDVKLVYLTVNEEPELAAKAFRAGASAFLLKRSAASELVMAVREVMQGRSYVTPLATQALVAALLHDNQQEPGHGLTAEQRQLLRLLAQGHSMKEVASRLDLTPRAVALHKYRMMEQLRIKSNAELIQYAVKREIV